MAPDTPDTPGEPLLRRDPDGYVHVELAGSEIPTTHPLIDASPVSPVGKVLELTTRLTSGEPGRIGAA